MLDHMETYFVGCWRKEYRAERVTPELVAMTARPERRCLVVEIEGFRPQEMVTLAAQRLTSAAQAL